MPDVGPGRSSASICACVSIAASRARPSSVSGICWDTAAYRRAVGRDVDRVLRPAQHRVHRDEDRELQQHGPAPGERVDPVLLVELHDLFLLTLLVALELLLDLLDLRLHDLHVLHRADLLDPEREQDQPDHDGEQDDGHAVVRDELVDLGDHPAERRPGALATGRGRSSAELRVYDTVIHHEDRVAGGTVVDTPGGERATPRDPPRGHERPADRAMRPDRSLGVVRARRVEATLAADPARQREAIQADAGRPARAGPAPPPSTRCGAQRITSRITCARESNSSTSATSSASGLRRSRPWRPRRRRIRPRPCPRPLATRPGGCAGLGCGAPRHRSAGRQRRPPTRSRGRQTLPPALRGMPGRTSRVRGDPIGVRHATYADSRVRPFARRRARIDRPAAGPHPDAEPMPLVAAAVVRLVGSLRHPGLSRRRVE